MSQHLNVPFYIEHKLPNGFSYAPFEGEALLTVTDPGTMDVGWSVVQITIDSWFKHDGKPVEARSVIEQDSELGKLCVEHVAGIVLDRIEKAIDKGELTR